MAESRCRCRRKIYVIAVVSIENLILAATCPYCSSLLLYRCLTKVNSRNLLSHPQSTPTRPKSTLAIIFIIVVIHAILFLLALRTFLPFFFLVVSVFTRVQAVLFAHMHFGQLVGYVVFSDSEWSFVLRLLRVIVCSRQPALSLVFVILPDVSPHNRSPFLSVIILVDAQSVRSQEVILIAPFILKPLLLGCGVACGPFVGIVGRSACWRLSGSGVAWRGVLCYLCGAASGFMLIVLLVGVTSG
jgi:hypothetical protein